MTKSNGSDRGVAASESFSQIHKTWATYLSNVYHWGVTEEVDALDVRVKCRGGGDWIAIAKRVGDDGQPEVLFATGFDLVSVWVALNASMASNRWKVDRPWDGGNGS